MIPTKKIAFWGTPPFTVAFLDMLETKGWKPSLIITNPDRPKGRGMTLTPPAPKVWAQTHHITVLQPEKIDEAFFSTLSKESWDLFVVVAYGRIIPEHIITLPTYGTINVHYSLLPKYRGASPLEAAILHGDTTTGVCIQQMRYKLDSGPILSSQEIAISPFDTTPLLRDKLNECALQLLPATIASLFSGTALPQEQSQEGVSHCSKISKEDGDITTTPSEIEKWRKFRALSGGVGIFFTVMKGGIPLRVKITKASYENNHFSIEEVIPPNGKKMPYDIFLQTLT